MLKEKSSTASAKKRKVLGHHILDRARTTVLTVIFIYEAKTFVEVTFGANM